MNDTPRAELPRWLWLYAPFAILVVQIVTRLGGEATYQRWMRGEISVVEIGTVAWALVAAAAGAAILIHRRRLPGWFGAWIALFALGAFFFAGEEASWGQHYFHWKTPEAWAALNDQKETGLHNVSAVFDQTPRTLLTIGAIAAVVIALWARRQPDRFGPGTRWYWLWPTYVVVPSAVLALVIGQPFKMLHRAPPNVLDLQSGEFKEYFLAMFLAMYALSLVVRLRRAPVA